MYTYILFFFFFNDTATTEIYTLSLHDALPISSAARRERLFLEDRLKTVKADLDNATARFSQFSSANSAIDVPAQGDRKSTRLNSSHGYISYAVFCLKKKQKKHIAFCPVHTHSH